MTVVISGNSGIVNVLGSASNPAESATGGSNTGLYFPSTTSVALSTNGVSAMTISSAQQAAFAQSVSATQGLSSASYLSPFASGYRNRIINGSMGIAQRGTSFSNPAKIGRAHV